MSIINYQMMKDNYSSIRNLSFSTLMFLRKLSSMNKFFDTDLLATLIYRLEMAPLLWRNLSLDMRSTLVIKDICAYLNSLYNKVK